MNRALLCLALVGSSLLGCSEDGTLFPFTVRDTGSDASPTDTSGPGPGDVAVLDIGPGDTAADDVGPTGDGFVGAVTVFETRAPGLDALTTGGVAAGFAPRPTAERDPVAVVGSCEIRPTDEIQASLAGGPSADAGDIVVEAAEAVYRLRRTETEDGYRYVGDAPTDQVEFFEPGDVVAIQADGGADLGAFAATVIAPAEPVISEPAWGMGDSSPRDEPLAIRWEGAAGSTVVVNIMPVELFPPGIADGNGITCAVDDTGQFSVPTEALDYLPSGGTFGGTSVALTVARLANSGPLQTAGGTAAVNATASHTVIGSVR